MLGNYLQQTTSANVIYQMHFFLGALRVKDFLDISLNSGQDLHRVFSRQARKIQKHAYFLRFSDNHLV